ncbi:MAG: hypothetical protein ACLTER_07455 [Ruminococcus sp.]
MTEFYREKEAKTSGDDLSGFTDGEEGFNDGEITVTQEDDSATETALQDDLRARQEALNEVIAGKKPDSGKCWKSSVRCQYAGGFRQYLGERTKRIGKCQSRYGKGYSASKYRGSDFVSF